MNLKQMLSVLVARWWIVLGVFAVTVGATTVVTLLLPKSYTATTSLVLEPKFTDVLGTSTLGPTMLSQTYMSTQLDIIQSPRVAAKVVSSLGLATNPTAVQQFKETGGVGSIEDHYASLLLRRLDIRPSRDSTVVALSFSAGDPRFAATVADAFAKAYLETTLDLRTHPAKQYANWFNEQLKNLRSDVERTQTKLSAFQQRNGIVGSDERFDVENSRLNELSTQLSSAQSLALDARSRSAAGTPDVTSVPDVSSTAVLNSLRGELARSEAKLEEMSQLYGSAHPSHQRQTAEVESMRSKIESELRNSSGSVSSISRASSQREAGLRSVVATQKQRVLDIKRQRDEMAVLAREVEHAQRLYDLALQRFSQTTLESQATQAGVSILSAASIPTTPSSPRTQLNIGLSAILGLLLGLAAAIMAELVDRRVRSGRDLAQGLGVQVLGAIPRPRRRLLGRAPVGGGLQLPLPRGA